MKIMKLNKILLSTALVGTLASCDMNEVYYSQTVPDNFIENEANVYQILSRPFGHWRAFVNDHRYNINELMADVFICPARTTTDWYNSGDFMARHYHTMDWQDGRADTNWKEAMQGIARCLTVMEQLEALDYKKLNMTEEQRAAHMGQMQALMGFFYWQAMDWYGGVPIYESTSDPLKPRATVQETFNKCEELLKAAVEGLPARQSLHEEADGYLKKAAAAQLLAQLYFNAKSYIGVEMYDKAAKLCEDIINGVYGPYELESDWRNVFNFENKTSSEIMWAVPADYALMQNNWYIWNFYPYNVYKYFGIKTGFTTYAYNGHCLQPSRNPEGKLYREIDPDFKVGAPYEAFTDGDLRKQLYNYNGGDYQGMFLIGELRDPNYPDRVADNIKPYRKGECVNIVDRIAPYSQLKGYATNESDVKYQTAAELPSTMYYCADEDDGVRLVKYPIPDESNYKLCFTCYTPLTRLAETYLTLAECKYRMGDTQKACELINTLRKRYFVNGQDPNPATPANLDKYRFLDEWLIEFIGEGRRRIDLIRWDAFHTEKWWDHEPTNDPKVCRLPVGDSVMGSNNLLKQNPGYGTGEDELTPDEI